MKKSTNGIKAFIKDFIEDESGLTAVEYAIAGGLVVGGMVGAFLTLGSNATTQINDLSCAAIGKTADTADAADVTADTSGNTALGDAICS